MIQNVALMLRMRERRHYDRRLPHGEEAGRALVQDHDDVRRLASGALRESIAQLLSAVTVNLDLIERGAPALTDRSRGLLTETRVIARECFRQLCAVADELSPWLVSEAGLRQALRCHVDAFVERTGAVVVYTSNDFVRLPERIELALFRMVDDCLESTPEGMRRVGMVVSFASHAGVTQLAVRPLTGEVAGRWQRRLALQFGRAIEVHIDRPAPTGPLPVSHSAPVGLVVRIPAVSTAR